MYDRYAALKVEQRGAVLWINLGNPPTNIMTHDVHRDLSHIFRDVSRDPAIRCVVLTGDGTRSFCAGGDPKTMLESVDDRRAWAAMIPDSRELILNLLECDKPVIARINGHAIGLGASIALCCDITVMVDTAKIGDTHVKMGLVAGDGGSLLWPYLVGLMTARRYLLTGDLLTGREAAEIGLITQAVPAETLDDAVQEWSDRFSSGATQAIGYTKRALNMALRRDAQLFMDASLGLETLTYLSNDHRVAIEAFVEKKKPDFTGR